MDVYKGNHPALRGKPNGDKIGLAAEPVFRQAREWEEAPVKSNHIVFVPGLFGWGPGELGGFPYWGGALEQFDKNRFQTHWVKCGPISSFHDRACEVFARIKGAKIDYGEPSTV
jgi:hypothetical protein